MTTTDNLEPITEEEIKSFEGSGLYGSIDFFPRLIKGYRDLKSKYDRLFLDNQKVLKRLEEDADDFDKELAEKERGIQKMKESLEFYSNENNWDRADDAEFVSLKLSYALVYDKLRGRKDGWLLARQCLKEVKGDFEEK